MENGGGEKESDFHFWEAYFGYRFVVGSVGCEDFLLLHIQGVLKSHQHHHYSVYHFLIKLTKLTVQS